MLVHRHAVQSTLKQSTMPQNQFKANTLAYPIPNSLKALVRHCRQSIGNKKAPIEALVLFYCLYRSMYLLNECAYFPFIVTSNSIKESSPVSSEASAQLLTFTPNMVLILDNAFIN